MTYTVKYGDTLGGIAKLLYGDSKYVDVLIKDNNILNPNMIYIGLELKYTPNDVYEVKPGDGFYRIAKELNVNVNDLLDANNLLLTSVIHPGLKLNIPRLLNRLKQLMTTTLIKQLEESINSKSNLEIINHYQEGRNQYYIIDDKENNRLSICLNGKPIRTFKAIHGKDRTSDDMTKTLVDEKGKLINLAGNLSTPAGIFFTTEGGNYHGAPSFIRQLKWHIDKGLSEGIPSSIHARTITETANSNGCTGMSVQDLKEMSRILKGQKQIPTYILPYNKENKFFIRNGELLFSSNSLDVPSHHTRVFNPIKRIGFNPEGLDSNKRSVIKEYALSLITNKKAIQEVLKINSDTYDELSKMALGILGAETNYGDEHSGFGNLLRAVLKFVSRSSKSKPDYKSAYNTYGLTGDGNSVGLTLIKMNSLSNETKELFKLFNITKDDLVNDPAKAAIATMLKLGDEYLRRGRSVEKAVRGWNNRLNYFDRVSKNSSRFNIYEEYKNGGILIPKFFNYETNTKI